MNTTISMYERDMKRGMKLSKLAQVLGEIERVFLDGGNLTLAPNDVGNIIVYRGGVVIGHIDFSEEKFFRYTDEGVGG